MVADLSKREIVNLVLFSRNWYLQTITTLIVIISLTYFLQSKQSTVLQHFINIGKKKNLFQDCGIWNWKLHLIAEMDKEVRVFSKYEGKIHTPIAPPIASVKLLKSRLNVFCGSIQGRPLFCKHKDLSWNFIKQKVQPNKLDAK